MTVVTLANANRLLHVQRQVASLPKAVPHLLVALDDGQQLAAGLPHTRVEPLGRFSLAAARNLAGDLAAEGQPDDAAIVFLDADCMAGPELLGTYERALVEHPDAVLAGPVTYLPEGVIQTAEPAPHAARPNLPEGESRAATDAEYRLFWSLSFAVTAGTWRRIRAEFGGFDTRYEGYGAEDTDFGQHLRQAGIELRWVGGAHAFHQWHPVSSPPWEHLDDILENAWRFHATWGWWPMEGWLDAFAEAGAIEFADGRWKRVPGAG